jgi:hypothetical protein
MAPEANASSDRGEVMMHDDGTDVILVVRRLR